MHKSKIKKIGNSWYVKLPSKLHKSLELHDNDEIFLDKLGNRIEIIFNIEDQANEIYETNRY